MKRLFFLFCLLPLLVSGANIDFRNLTTNHFTTNGYRVSLKNFPTNTSPTNFVTVLASNYFLSTSAATGGISSATASNIVAGGPFIKYTNGYGTNTTFVTAANLSNANFYIYQGQTNPFASPIALENAAGALSGIYTYQYTWVTDFGESAPSAISEDANPSSQSIDVTGILTGPSYVTGRKVYRSRAGGSGYLYLVTNIANNVTTLFTDNKADANLGEAATLVNRSSGGEFFLNGEPIGRIDTENVIWGLRAGASNRTSGQSVILGTDAGASLSAGSDGTTAIGAQSLQYLTNGAGNTPYGTRALRFLRRGQQNSAKGIDSLGELIEGDFNTADGWDSLYAMRYGTNNAAFAKFAGERLYSGSNNLFLGAHSQPAKTTEVYITNRNGMVLVGAYAEGHTNYVGVLGGSDPGGSSPTNWYIGQGYTNASPGGYVLHASSGLGTDVKGGDATIAAGRGTGAGIPGKVQIAVSAAGASGATLQTLVTGVTVTATGVGIGSGSPFILHGDGNENYLSNSSPAYKWISFNSINENVIIYGNTPNRLAAYDGSGGLTSVAAGTDGQALFKTSASYAWSNVVAGSSSGSATNIPGYMTLSNNVAVGDTTFTVLGTPPMGFGSRAALLAIRPYHTNGEVRAVISKSGSTFTTEFPFRLAHTAGEDVLILPTFEIPVLIYAPPCDNGVTDDWMAVQRGKLEAQRAGATLVGGPNLASRIFICGQPIYFGGGGLKKLRVATINSLWNTNNLVGTNSVFMHWMRENSDFTAIASTNNIFYSGNLGYGAGGVIAFNNPYGETLPGGIISGRIYLIKTVNDAAGTMTISEVATPSTELDITTDGAGYAWGNKNSFGAIAWDDVEVSVGVTNLGGEYHCIQQPGYTRNSRVNMNAGGDLPVRMFDVTGQMSVHYNLMLVPHVSGVTNLNTNTIPVSITGTGHTIDYVTINGQGAACGVQVTGRDNKIGYLLAEQISGQALKILPGTKGFQLEMGYWSAPDTNTPFVENLSGLEGSYEIGLILSSTGDRLFARDVTRGYTMGCFAADTDADVNHAFFGYYQAAGSRGPQLKGRRQLFNVNNNHQMKHIEECVMFNTSLASYTNTLPDTTGWYGLEAEVVKQFAANVVAVKGFGSQTIDGSASDFVLTAAGESARFRADGANWYRVRPASSGGGTPAGVWGQLQYNSNGVFQAANAYTTNNSVGIGTNDPQNTLHVNGGIRANPFPAGNNGLLVWQNVTTGDLTKTNTIEGSLTFEYPGAFVFNNAGVVAGQIEANAGGNVNFSGNHWSFNAGTHNTELGINTNGHDAVTLDIFSTNATAALRITSPHGTILHVGTNGYVGIGTNAPAAKLHVHGNLNVTDPVVTIAGTEAIIVQPSPRNNFFGGAGNTNATGSNDGGFGYWALHLLSSGINNSAFGNYALAYNTTGFGNTAVGTSSLYTNSVGYDNSAFGADVLLWNTGQDNSSFGSRSSYYTSGTNNTVSGVEALYGNVRSDQIVDGNFSAGTQWTFGSGWVLGTGKADHSSDGTATLQTGAYIDYGIGAAYRITYTVTNRSVGSVTASFAGISDTARSADGNYTFDVTPAYHTNSEPVIFTPTSTARLSITAVRLVVTNLSIAHQNTVQGVGALYMATTAMGNSVNGLNAARQMTTGSRNVIDGVEAGLHNGQGNNNVFSGYRSGYTGNGSSNVFVGPNSGFYETGNGKFMVDNTPRTSEANARANAILYGTFGTAADQTLQVNGNLGILGVPVFPLDVTGIARFQGEVRMAANDITGLDRLQWNNGGAIQQNDPDTFSFTWYSGAGATATMTVDENNRVGIGTNAPTAVLHVHGTTLLNGPVTFNGPTLTNKANYDIVTTDFVINTTYTNDSRRASVVFSVDLDANATGIAKAALLIDQAVDGTYETTIPVQATGLSDAVQHVITGWLQPGARFAITNLSSGAGSPTAAVIAGSSQWVKQ